MPKEGRFTEIKHNAWLASKVTDGVFELVDKLDPIAAEKGCTLAQLALTWVLGRPGVTSPIIGPRTMEQFEDNLGALEVVLSDDDLSKIDKFIPPGSMVSPFYEADFGPNLYR